MPGMRLDEHSKQVALLKQHNRSKAKVQIRHQIVTSKEEMYSAGAKEGRITDRNRSCATRIPATNSHS